MTGIYTGAPGNSPIDAVRFWCGDQEHPYELSDQEILALLAENEEHVKQAAIGACQVLAARYAKDVDKKVGDLSLSASQRHQHYLSLAEALQKSEQTKQVRKSFVLPFAGGLNKSAFRRRLHGS